MKVKRKCVWSISACHSDGGEYFFKRFFTAVRARAYMRSMLLSRDDYLNFTLLCRCIDKGSIKYKMWSYK